MTTNLADTRAQCGKSASAACDTWSTTVIDGYPAIRATSDLEARLGSCKLLLGVSDTVAVLLNDVRTRTASPTNCDRAEKVAAMVIAALR